MYEYFDRPPSSFSLKFFAFFNRLTLLSTESNTAFIGLGFCVGSAAFLASLTTLSIVTFSTFASWNIVASTVQSYRSRSSDLRLLHMTQEPRVQSHLSTYARSQPVQLNHPEVPLALLEQEFVHILL